MKNEKLVMKMQIAFLLSRFNVLTRQLSFLNSLVTQPGHLDVKIKLVEIEIEQIKRELRACGQRGQREVESLLNKIH